MRSFHSTARSHSDVKLKEASSIQVIMADTTRYVPEHRRQTYKGKNLFKGDEVRRRREEQQVEIRKQKKEENLAKRRNLAIVANDTSMESDTDEDISGEDDKVFVPLCVLLRGLTRYSGERSYPNWFRRCTRITSTINFPRRCNFENSFQRREILLLKR